jgi:hypothetical protein
MTFAPACTKVLAVASPMPWLAPVIKTVLPLKFIILGDPLKITKKFRLVLYIV